MKGLVGGPLLVGGLGTGPPGPPLNPALRYLPFLICRQLGLRGRINVEQRRETGE